MPKHAHEDPYARVFDVEEDDFDDYYAHGYPHEDLAGGAGLRDEFGHEAFGGLFPSLCCMPGPTTLRPRERRDGGGPLRGSGV